MHRFTYYLPLRNLPWWLAITALNTSVLIGLLLWRQAARGTDLAPPLTELLLVFWMAVAIYLLFGRPASRSPHLALTLPIPTRVLWRRQFVSSLIAGLVVLATSLGVLALHDWLLDSGGGRPALQLEYSPFVLPLVAGLLLVTTLIDGIEPGLWNPRTASGYRLKVAAALTGVLALLLLMQNWPVLAAASCALSAVAVLRRSVRALPLAYRLVPARAAEPRRTDRSTEAVAMVPSGAVGQRRIWRLVYTVLHTAPPWKQAAPWLLYFFVGFMGFLLAGGFDRWFDARELRYLYLPLGSYMLLAGFGLLTYHLYRIDPLPLPRRTLFAILVMPGILWFCFGYAGGLLALATDPEPRPALDYKVLPPRAELGSMVWVDIDPAFMRASLSGRVPALTSDWGESHPAWSEPLFRGLPIRVYNPYNTAAETSADFEALLTSRAIEAVYGRSLPPATISDRYFEIENDKVSGVRQSSRAASHQETGFARTLLADHPDLEPPDRGPETPVFLMLGLVPGLLLIGWIVRSFRAENSERFVRVRYWLALGVLLGALLVQVLLSIFGLLNTDAAIALLAMLIHRLGEDPLLRILTWLASLAAISFSYRVALRQFERAEIPPAPIRCTLVDWSQPD